jgi:hypothetical protein
MKAPEKEAVRWMRQSEDDFKFAQWVLSEKVFFDIGSLERIIEICRTFLSERGITY